MQPSSVMPKLKLPSGQNEAPGLVWGKLLALTSLLEVGILHEESHPRGLLSLFCSLLTFHATWQCGQLAQGE